MGVYKFDGMAARQDSLVLPEKLTSVLRRVLDNYRPLKFRQVLRVNNSTPEWADTISVEKITENADVKPLSQIHNHNFPEPSLSASRQLMSLVAFGAGYSYSDSDITRAVQMQMDVPTLKADANSRKAEQILDEIAASGDPFGLGMPGLGNNADVPTVTAVTKAAGGTTWAVATADEILTDMHALVDEVEINTLEAKKSDTLVLPDAQFNIIRTKRAGVETDKTVLEVFRAQRDEPIKIVKWNRFSTLGAGTTPRACALAANDPTVAEMQIPREWMPDTPIRQPFGWFVAQMMVVGGVLISDANGVAYMDAL